MAPVQSLACCSAPIELHHKYDLHKTWLSLVMKVNSNITSCFCFILPNLI